MTKLRWIADVEANPQIVIKDGQDPVAVQLHKGLVFEASENDPYIARAIARDYAKVVTEHKKPASPLDDPPEEDDAENSNQDNQEEAE